MKKAMLKLLPYVVGIGLGIMLFHPPAFLHELGAIAYLVMAAVAAVLFLGFVGLLLLGGFPANLQLTPASNTALPPDMQALFAQLTATGFRPAGSLLTVGIAPPALLMPFVHEHEPIYGTLFRTGTAPAKVSYDCVSILMGDRGGLTTGPEPAAGFVPAPPGSLRQIFAKAPPAELIEHHRRALAYLSTRGIAARPVDASTFADDFRQGFARARQAFLRRPIYTTAATAWRALTRANPHRGPLGQQTTIEQQLSALVS